jgi:general nucleoside transport system permease protein
MLDVLKILQYATPVALASIGETISQKAGIINVGLEGTMLAGAFSGVVATLATGNPWVGLFVATLVGMFVSLILGWFCVRHRADQVVVGTAINLALLGLTGTLYRLKYASSNQLIDVEKLPNAGGFDVVMGLTLALAGLGYFVLTRTSWGLVLRAAGEYPAAVEAGGFRLSRIRFGALAVNGTMAGLAGAYLSLGIVGTFTDNMTAGRGFVAIALVTFGRWNPIAVLGAALLVGFLESLQFKFQAGGSAIPYQLLLALPYVLALLVLVILGKGAPAPNALGRSYKGDS